MSSEKESNFQARRPFSFLSMISCLPRLHWWAKFTRSIRTKMDFCMFCILVRILLERFHWRISISATLMILTLTKWKFRFYELDMKNDESIDGILFNIVPIIRWEGGISFFFYLFIVWLKTLVGIISFFFLFLHT